MPQMNRDEGEGLGSHEELHQEEEEEEEEDAVVSRERRERQRRRRRNPQSDSPEEEEDDHVFEDEEEEEDRLVGDPFVDRHSSFPRDPFHLSSLFPLDSSLHRHLSHYHHTSPFSLPVSFYSSSSSSSSSSLPSFSSFPSGILPLNASLPPLSSSASFSYYTFPSQVLSRDAQRQPRDQDAWAEFHNACAAALALPSVSPSSSSHLSCSSFSTEATCCSSSPSSELVFVTELLLRKTAERRSSSSSFRESSSSSSLQGASGERRKAEEERNLGRRKDKLKGRRRRKRSSPRRDPTSSFLSSLRSSSCSFSSSSFPSSSPQMVKQRDQEAFAEFLQNHGEAYTPDEFGGFLLGLGLRGYFHKYSAYEGESTWLRLLWEAFDQETVQTGLILGLTSSFAGTRLKSLEQLCLAHLPSSLHDSFVEVEMKSTPQCAALLGLGLLYSCSSSQAVSRLLLYHFLRPPCLLSDKQRLDRGAYALSAAWAIGALWSGGHQHRKQQFFLSRKKKEREGKFSRRKERRIETMRGKTPREERKKTKRRSEMHMEEEAPEKERRDRWERRKPEKEEDKTEDEDDESLHCSRRKPRGMLSSSSSPCDFELKRRREKRDSSTSSSSRRKNGLSVFWRELITIANLNTSRPWASVRRDFFHPPSSRALRHPSANGNTSSQRTILPEYKRDESSTVTRRRRRDYSFLFSPPSEDFYKTKERQGGQKTTGERSTSIFLSPWNPSSSSSSSIRSSHQAPSSVYTPRRPPRRCFLQQDWFSCVLLSRSSLLPRAFLPSIAPASSHTRRRSHLSTGGFEEEAIEEEEEEGEGAPLPSREEEEGRRESILGGERSFYRNHATREGRLSFLETSRRDEAPRERDIPAFPSSSSSSSSFPEGLDRGLSFFLTAEGTQASSETPPLSSSSSSPYRSNLHWGCVNASEVSGPAAIAVGLAFLDSENEEARQGLRIPNDLDQLLDLLPHVLMCKVLARALIGWSSIVASHRWIAAQLPPVLRLLPTDFLHRPGKIPASSSSSPPPPPPFTRVVDCHTRRILSPSSPVLGAKKQRSSSARLKKKKQQQRPSQDTGVEATFPERDSQRESCRSSSRRRRRSNRRRRTSQHDGAPDCDMDLISSAQDLTAPLDSSRRSSMSRQAYIRGKGGEEEEEEVDDDASMRGREKQARGRTRRKKDGCLQEERTRRLMRYASTPPDGVDGRGSELLVPWNTDAISTEEKDLKMKTTRETEEVEEQTEERKKNKASKNKKKVTQLRGNPEEDEEAGDEERLNGLSRLPFSSSVGKYRIYALAGALWALGLRYAGSYNRRCLHLLLRYMHYLRRGQCGRLSSSSSPPLSPSEAPPLGVKKKCKDVKRKKKNARDNNADEEEEEVSLLRTDIETRGSFLDRKTRTLYRSTPSHRNNGARPPTHPSSSSSSSFLSQDHHLPLYDERMTEREEGRIHERFPLQSNPSLSSTSNIPRVSSSYIMPRSSSRLPPRRRRLSLSSLSPASSSLLQSIFTTLSLFSLPLPPPSASLDEAREALRLQTSGRHTTIEQQELRRTSDHLSSSFPSSSSSSSVLSSLREEEEEDLSFFLKYASHNVEEEEAVDVCALTCCLSLALVAAGSCDVEVLKTLFYERNLRITRSQAETGIASTALTSALISQLTAGGSSSSGEGYESASAVAKVTEKYRQQSQYGVLMLLHQALGIVCMSGGRASFREGFLHANPLDISVLLLSFYPLRPPADAGDHRSHLQACRHLWVLATESRALLPVDVDTQKSLMHRDRVTAKIVSMKTSRKVSTKKTNEKKRNEEEKPTKRMLRMKRCEISLPALLPSPQRLVELKIDQDNYYPVVLRNPSYSQLLQTGEQSGSASSDEEALDYNNNNKKKKKNSSKILAPSLEARTKVHRQSDKPRAIDQDDKEASRDLSKRKKLFSLPSSSSLPLLPRLHLDCIVKKLNIFHHLFSSRDSGRGGLLFLKRRGHLHLSEEGYERSPQTACALGELSKEEEEKTPSTTFHRCSTSRKVKHSRCSSSSSCSLSRSSFSALFPFSLPRASRSSRPHAHLSFQDLFRSDNFFSSLVALSEKRSLSDEHVRLLGDLLHQQEAFNASYFGRAYAVIRLAQYLIRICGRLLLRSTDSSYRVGRLGKETDRPSLFRWMRIQGNEDKEEEEEEDEDRQVYRRLEVLKMRLEMIERKLLYTYSRRIRSREDRKRKMMSDLLHTPIEDERINHPSFSPNKNASVDLSARPSSLLPLSSYLLFRPSSAVSSKSRHFLYPPPHHRSCNDKPVVFSRDSSQSPVFSSSSSSSFLLSSPSRSPQQGAPVYRRVLSKVGREEETERRRERKSGQEEEDNYFSLSFIDTRDDISEDVDWMSELDCLEREVYTIRDGLLMRGSSDRYLGENEDVCEARIAFPSSSSVIQHPHSTLLRPFPLYTLSEERGRREEEEEGEFLWPWQSGSYGEEIPQVVLHRPLEALSLRFLYRFFTYLMTSHLSVPSHLRVFPSSSSSSFASRSFSSPDLSVLSLLLGSYRCCADTTDGMHATTTMMLTGISTQQENSLLGKTTDYLPPSSSSSLLLSACSREKSFPSRFRHQGSERSLLSLSADSRRKETGWRSSSSLLRLLPLQKASSEILHSISCKESILRERELQKKRRKYWRLRETAIVTYAISGLLGLKPGVAAALPRYGRSEAKSSSSILRKTSPSSSSSSSSSFASRGGAPCGALCRVVKDEVEEEEDTERCNSFRRSKRSRMKARGVFERVPSEREGRKEEIEMKSGREEEEVVLVRSDGREEDQQEGEKKERKLRISPMNRDLEREKEKERHAVFLDYTDDDEEEEEDEKAEEGGVYTQFVSFIVLHDLPLISTWKAFCRDYLQDIFSQKRSSSSSSSSHLKSTSPTSLPSLPSSPSPREEERKERNFSSAFVSQRMSLPSSALGKALLLRLAWKAAPHASQEALSVLAEALYEIKKLIEMQA